MEKLDLTNFNGRPGTFMAQESVDLLLAECRRLQAENERLREALEKVIAHPSGNSGVQAIARAALGAE